MNTNESTEDLLSPYRILDLTDERGFLCGKILADLGADVIKVERPGGDRSRNIGPFYQSLPHPERSLYWFAYNTSKRGVTLNIESKDGQEIFKKLVKTADCVVESFPIGYLDRLNLGWPDLRRINPRIVLASITPFGLASPRRHHRICDLTAQALSGMMDLCGESGRAPYQFGGAETRQAYLQTGAQAALATMIALFYRQSSGKGQHVDVPISESMAWAGWATQIAIEWEGRGLIMKRASDRSQRGNIWIRGIYHCKDGYAAVRILYGVQGHFTKKLVEFAQSAGMAEDLTKVDWENTQVHELIQEDVNHWQEVLARFFLSHTKSELSQAALERGFVLFPVNGAEDLLNDPQLVSRDFFVDVLHAELGRSLIYPGAPYRSTVCPPRIRFRAPLAGEHNEEVYQELGLSKGEMVSLKEAGII